MPSELYVHGDLLIMTVNVLPLGLYIPIHFNHRFVFACHLTISSQEWNEGKTKGQSDVRGLLAIKPQLLFRRE